MFPVGGDKMKTGEREVQIDKRVFMATLTNSWFRVKLCSFLRRGYSSSPSAVPRCSLEPPDVNLLAESARISLTPKEVEDFAPKIRQVIDWFGQLQAVDLESIEPALRADTEVDGNSRLDSPEIFENREAILAGIPCYEEPYIKVPKVINKE